MHSFFNLATTLFRRCHVLFYLSVSSSLAGRRTVFLFSPTMAVSCSLTTVCTSIAPVESPPILMGKKRERKRRKGGRDGGSE